MEVNKRCANKHLRPQMLYILVNDKNVKHSDEGTEIKKVKKKLLKFDKLWYY